MLGRTDIELLVVPLLRHLYAAASRKELSSFIYMLQVGACCSLRLHFTTMLQRAAWIHLLLLTAAALTPRCCRQAGGEGVDVAPAPGGGNEGGGVLCAWPLAPGPFPDRAGPRGIIPLHLAVRGGADAQWCSRFSVLSLQNAEHRTQNTEASGGAPRPSAPAPSTHPPLCIHTPLICAHPPPPAAIPPRCRSCCSC